MAENTDTNPVNLIKQGVAIQGVKQMIAPRVEIGDGNNSEVAIIRGLGVDDYIKEAYLQLKGYSYNYLTGKWELLRAPLMNSDGIGNMINFLHSTQKLDFSNFDEKRIPHYIYHEYEEQVTHFIMYAKEFELKDFDLNIIKALIFNRLMSAFFNAKNAGHRNTVRGTLSENVFARALQGDQNKKKGFLTSIFGKADK